MSFLNWFRRKPDYAIWVDRTDKGRYLARIVDSVDAESVYRSKVGSPRNIFVMPISKRVDISASAWADAVVALTAIGADNPHLATCYIEKEDGGVSKWDPKS